MHPKPMDEVKSSEESVMYRYEQEQTQRCTTRSRKGMSEAKLNFLKYCIRIGAQL